MQSEYDAVMKNRTWKIVDCPHDVKPGFTESSTKQMEILINIRQDWWQRVLLRKKGLIKKKVFLQQKNGILS